MAAPRSPNGDKRDIDLERGNADQQEQLRNMLSNTLTLSPEAFEGLYLNPKNQVAGDLRKTFANPTPIALMGFAVGLTPLSCEFMQWRGAAGFGVATTTASIWYGGMLLILAGFGEFLLGNTFPFIVFMGYGAHFLTYSTTFIPWFNAIGYFKPGSEAGVAQITPTFATSYAFYPLSLGILSFIFLLGSLRTNFMFVLIFVCATTGFGFAAGAFWQVAEGNMTLGVRLVVATGACFFAASMIGWYLLASIIIATMELPIPDLPIFDLSTVIKPRSRAKAE